MELPVTKSDMSELRLFLEGMQTPRGPKRIPKTLFLLARQAIGAHQPEDVNREAVSTWLLKLTVATRSGTPGSAHALLELDDRRLVAVVRHRLAQCALQSYPGWQLLKALRAHVRAVLHQGI